MNELLHLDETLLLVWPMTVDSWAMDYRTMANAVTWMGETDKAPFDKVTEQAPLPCSVFCLPLLRFVWFGLQLWVCLCWHLVPLQILFDT